MKVEIRTEKQVVLCGSLRTYSWQDGKLSLFFIGKIDGVNIETSLNDEHKLLLVKLSEAHMYGRSFCILTEPGFMLGNDITDVSKYLAYKQGKLL